MFLTQLLNSIWSILTLSIPLSSYFSYSSQGSEIWTHEKALWKHEKDLSNYKDKSRSNSLPAGHGPDSLQKRIYEWLWAYNKMLQPSTIWMCKPNIFGKLRLAQWSLQTIYKYIILRFRMRWNLSQGARTILWHRRRVVRQPLRARKLYVQMGWERLGS